MPLAASSNSRCSISTVLQGSQACPPIGCKRRSTPTAPTASAHSKFSHQGLACSRAAFITTPHARCLLGRARPLRVGWWLHREALAARGFAHPPASTPSMACGGPPDGGGTGRTAGESAGRGGLQRGRGARSPSVGMHGAGAAANLLAAAQSVWAGPETALHRRVAVLLINSQVGESVPFHGWPPTATNKLLSVTSLPAC
jgi:hypothetical protein